jgi:hypothetical protein
VGNRVLPLQVQTAYQDLLQRFRALPEVSIPGSLLKVAKAGRDYWIARQRIGSKLREEQIGPDTAEIRSEVEAAVAQQAAFVEWNRENARLVAMLRAAGCLTPDMATGKLLSALDRVGFFAAGGIIGGTHAFRHYPLELGVEGPSAVHSMTGDLDILAPTNLALSGDGGSLTARLAQAGLEVRTVFGMTDEEPRHWVVDGTVELEILSPVRRGGKTSHLHEGVGERVQALRYLEFAFKEPLRAVSLYRGGVAINVPSPQRYALHKLLVAQLRSGGFLAKKRKDLNQAEWLVATLAEFRPYELWEAWADLWNRGPRWRKLAEASIAEREPVGAALRQVEQQFGQVRGA